MQYREGYLAWVNRETLNFGTMQVTFDKDLYAAMVDCLEQFWTENLVGGKEPDIVSVDDVMIKFPRSTSGKTVEVTDEVMEAISEIKTTKPLIKELESRLEEAENTVKTFMADAEVLCLPGTKESNPQIVATWKTGKDKEKFDAKSFKAENEELSKRYTTTVPGNRQFLVK
jgi:predicted phage-related endonuclease